MLLESIGGAFLSSAGVAAAAASLEVFAGELVSTGGGGFGLPTLKAPGVGDVPSTGDFWGSACASKRLGAQKAAIKMETLLIEFINVGFKMSV